MVRVSGVWQGMSKLVVTSVGNANAFAIPGRKIGVSKRGALDVSHNPSARRDGMNHANKGELAGIFEAGSARTFAASKRHGRCGLFLRRLSLGLLLNYLRHRMFFAS